MKNQTTKIRADVNYPPFFPVLVIVLLAVFSVAGCHQAESQPGGMPPSQVNVITASGENLPVEFEYTGETAGSREVEVRARVTGILQKHNYVEGGKVDSGQSLFTIDPAPYAAALSRARADVTSAKAQLDIARRNAQRAKPLYDDKAISQKDYDDFISNEVIADAELKSAQARLTQARLDFEYTRVESPINGIAGRALRSEGNYVTGPEVLLTSVTQIDPIYVLFGISDEERRRLQRESAEGKLVLPPDGSFSVTIKMADETEYTQTGKLTFTDVRISGNTGTSQARAELPNPDGHLRPGQFVRVVLKGAYRPSAVVIPQRAVLDGPGGKFVYVVDKENKAQARPVTVGEWHGDQWVINAGLSSGDQVIVDGVMKIGPGAPVQVATAGSPAPDTNASTEATTATP